MTLVETLSAMASAEPAPAALLVTAAKGGDRRAFGALVEAHWACPAATRSRLNSA